MSCVTILLRAYQISFVRHLITLVKSSHIELCIMLIGLSLLCKNISSSFCIDVVLLDLVFLNELLYSIEHSMTATYLILMRKRITCLRQEMNVNIDFVDTDGYSLFYLPFFSYDRIHILQWLNIIT